MYSVMITTVLKETHLKGTTKRAKEQLLVNGCSLTIILKIIRIHYQGPHNNTYNIVLNFKLPSFIL